MTNAKPAGDQKRYTIRLASVGNPDFQQYAPISPPETFSAETLQEIRDAARAYIEKWNLGGGNWSERKAMIRENGKAIGYVSYNGRVWRGNPKNWKNAEEIVLGPEKPVRA